MSARIPHLLTRLLTESECDALRDKMLSLANVTGGAAHRTWLAAAALLKQHRADSLVRRTNQTPSARRKALSYRASISA